MNYFSPMNPNSSYISINWISLLLPILIFSLPPSLPFPRPHKISSKIFLALSKEITPLLKFVNSQSLQIPFLTIFLIIMTSNLTGLLPFVFTHTSHMTFNLPLSFTLWLTLMIFAWLNCTNHMLAHLVPQNSPTPLIPFMIIIELISLIIRPLTLSVRLTTNMIAGHLLLTLLNSLGPILINHLNLFSSMSIPQLILLTLETAVAIIQAYVFSILLSLYLSETN